MKRGFVIRNYLPGATIVFLLLHLLASPAPGQRIVAPDVWRGLHEVPRSIPVSGDHPGNVFLSADEVRVKVPGDGHLATRWTVTDDSGGQVAAGQVDPLLEGWVALGSLPIGWYHIDFQDSSEHSLAWTTAAVLSRLAAPTPQDSPICVDSATAWFAENDPDKQKHFGRLASLAGVNWVRDRLRWREIQPSRDTFAQQTTYDTSATLQHGFGLKVLQVFHDTPPWAATGRDGRGRFPGDLRHAYRLAREMSRRFEGRVQAWEPWNEANVATFGGHTIDEICSYQKAAYLGFKAGAADVTVGWSVTTAVPTQRQTEGVLRNKTWSYFDTYNIHTYDWAHDYERLWGPARIAACGRPIWITESDRGMKCEESSPNQDLSRGNERLKAQYVTQSYVTSMHAGANRHFHFILGQYSEGTTQFGLLRHDLTPRMGYVALAAAGRLLAGARSRGRYAVSDNPDIHVYVMQAVPDGIAKDVIVAWAEQPVDWPSRGKYAVDWPLPRTIQPECCYDYLGRSIGNSVPAQLTSSPVYLILPAGSSRDLSLSMPQLAGYREGVVSPIVLQCLMPTATARKLERIPWASEYEHAVLPDQPTDVPLIVYNFSSAEVRGTVRVESAPAGCRITPDVWDVRIPPLGRTAQQ